MSRSVGYTSMRAWLQVGGSIPGRSEWPVRVDNSWNQRRRQVKKVALAGFFLVLVALGIAYNRAHDPAPSSGSAVGAGGLSWVTVRDTREKAFSIQVPQDWKTYGGLFRFSTID